MSTDHNPFEEKGEPKRIRTEVSLLTSLTARPDKLTWPLSVRSCVDSQRFERIDAEIGAHFSSSSFVVLYVHRSRVACSAMAGHFIKPAPYTEDVSKFLRNSAVLYRCLLCLIHATIFQRGKASLDIILLQVLRVSFQ